MFQKCKKKNKKKKEEEMLNQLIIDHCLNAVRNILTENKTFF